MIAIKDISFISTKESQTEEKIYSLPEPLRPRLTHSRPILSANISGQTILSGDGCPL